MEIREVKEGDVLVLAPEGSIAGSEETSAIETKLAAVLKAGTRLLIFDCTDVSQLAGAAIRALLTMSRKFERAEGRLVLCGMNAKVKKAFSISGFDKDFVIVATRADAMPRVLEPTAPRARVPAKKAAKAPAAIEAAPPPPPTVEEAPAAAPEPAPSPIEDRREAVADALLEAMGIIVARSDPALVGRNALSNPDALTDAILEALQAGPS